MTEQILALEQEARNAVVLGDDAVALLLHDGYQRILRSHTRAALDVMSARLRHDTDVLLVGSRKHPYQDASVLHRFLLACLFLVDKSGTRGPSGRVTTKLGNPPTGPEILDGALVESVPDRWHLRRHGPKRRRLQELLPRIRDALWNAPGNIPLIAGFDAPGTWSTPATSEWRRLPMTSCSCLRGGKEVIVTLDADFHALLALSNASTPSVVRLRIEGLRAQPLAALLRTVLIVCDADLRAGAMVSVDGVSVRVRALPLVRGTA
jgi:hypothetical protein